jgi:hypothetical protein
MDGLWADLVDQLVDESHIGESTSGHDLVIASSGTIGVEVFRADSSALKISGSWGTNSDLSGWGNVISCDGITHVQKNVSVFDAINRLNISTKLLEEWWVVNVG